MVHALEEIHRLLRPEGRLIDIHPVPVAPIVQVLRDGEVIFSKPKRDLDDLDEDVVAADRAVEEVLRVGLYELERREEFDFYSYGATVAELREFWDQYNAYDDSPKDDSRVSQAEAVYAEAELVRQGSGDSAQAAIHERTTIACLKPIRR